MRRFLLIVLLALTAGLYFSDRIAGAFILPVLEAKLSRLFGMPFQANSLRANLVTGRVTARAVQFMNQPGYSYAPHLHVREMIFYIDFPALREKRVDISRIELIEPFYLIERRNFEGGKASNIKDWINNIKARRKKKKEEAPPKPAEKKGPSWQVNIHNILIRRGVFIYDDHTQSDISNRFVFHHLEGNMSGFEWPAGDPAHLKQTLNLRGLIGDRYPAPVEVHGAANFPTGKVSFDLEGRIHGGTMAEYRRFWSDLPIVIQEGQFDLHIRMFCDQKKVKSDSQLRLYDLKVAPGASASDLFWGIPMTGALGFLQNEKEILLKVPVSGDITDPQFDFYRGFSKAFQNSLGQKLQGGVKILTQTPGVLVEQTRSVVSKAPGMIVQAPAAIVQAPEKLAAEITTRIENIGTAVVPKKET